MSGPAVASVVSVASFVSVVIGGAVVSPSCMQPIKLMFSLMSVHSTMISDK